MRIRYRMWRLKRVLRRAGFRGRGTIFTGNIRLDERRYDPSALLQGDITDAAAAAFPGVADFSDWYVGTHAEPRT